jgi:hypothetical protein
MEQNPGGDERNGQFQQSHKGERADMLCYVFVGNESRRVEIASGMISHASSDIAVELPSQIAPEERRGDGSGKLI